MAEKKYLDEIGLQDVAGHVNTRLKTVTTMPASANNGAVRLYVGTTDSTYTQGHIYQYSTTQSKWVDITPSADISNKADKVSSATNGDLAGLDSNGNLTDSGILATNVVVKSDTTGLIKNDGTIDTNTYATTTQLANKADKVASATIDDFATLDSNGNLTDSGINKNIVPSNASSSNKLATVSDVSAAYRPSGNATLATLPPLTEANLNRVYNMTADFTTTSDFAEGAGIAVKAGNEVGIIDVSSTSTPNIKYTVLGGFVDLSNYIEKSNTAGLIKNDGTVDQTSYATAASVSNILNGLLNTWSNQTKLGSHNVLNNTYKTTTLSNGVTITVNDDKSIELNGTSTAIAAFYMTEHTYVENETYIFSAAINGGYTSTSDAFLFISKDGSDTWICNSRGSETNRTFTPSDITKPIRMGIRIESGKTFNHFKFYPMIRLASDPNTVYTAPAMSNLGLTKDKMSWSDYAQIGVHNYLPNLSSTYDYTLNNVHFVYDNSTGIVTVDSSGSQATEYTTYAYTSRQTQFFTLPVGKYKLIPNKTGNDRAYLSIGSSNVGDGSTGSYVPWAQTYNEDKEFYVNDSNKRITFAVAIAQGDIVNSTFQPMIVRVEDNNRNYTPYTENNLQLTQNKLSWEDNRILGTHNLLVLNDWCTIGDATIRKLNTGIEVVGTTAGMPNYATYVVYLPKNKDFVFSSDVTVVSGEAEVFINGATGSSEVQLGTASLSSNGKMTISFNSGNYQYFYFAFFSNFSDSVIGDVKFENLMLRYSSDINTTYQTPALTNLQLTSNKLDVNSFYDIGFDIDNITTGFFMSNGNKVRGTTPYTLPGGMMVSVFSWASGDIVQQMLIDAYNGKISTRTKYYNSGSWSWASWRTTTLS